MLRIISFLGLLAVVIGGAVALIAGPDDMAFGKTSAISQGVAYTVPKAFPYKHVDVIVRAQGRGQTFIGMGNPVDVLDLVGGRTAYEVQHDTFVGLSGVKREGEELPDPSTAPWWQKSVAGKGAQELDVSVGDEPESFLVQGQDRTPVTLAFGYRIKGIFAASVCLVLVGALAYVWSKRRRKARRTQRQQRPPRQQGRRRDRPAPDAEPVPSPRRPMPAEQPVPPPPVPPRSGRPDGPPAPGKQPRPGRRRAPQPPPEQPVPPSGGRRAAAAQPPAPPRTSGRRAAPPAPTPPPAAPRPVPPSSRRPEPRPAPAPPAPRPGRRSSGRPAPAPEPQPAPSRSRRRSPQPNPAPPPSGRPAPAPQPRPGRPQPPPPPPPAQPRPPQPGRPSRPPRPPEPRRPRIQRSWSLIGGAGVLALGLSGCAQVPQVVVHPEATKVALTKAQMDAMATSYTKRDKTAIKANEQGTKAAWAMADTGPALAADEADAGSQKPVKVLPRSIWSPRLPSYPLWTVVEVKGKKRASTALAVFQQDHSLSEWKLRCVIGLKSAVVPMAPVEGGEPVGDDVEAQATQVSDEIAAYWTKRKKPADLDAFRMLGKLGGKLKGTKAVHVEPYDDDSTHLVQTPDGVLAIWDYRVTAKDDGSKVRYYASAAVTIPDDGTPQVIGVDWGEMTS